MDINPLHKELGTLADTTSSEKILSSKYYLLVDVGDHVEGILKFFWQVVDKVKLVELSIFIFTEDYIKY